jgi:hypothetical protein
MNSKRPDGVKVAPGWGSTRKPSTGPLKYTKADLLDAYEPAASTEGLPSGMNDHQGVTSTEPLVPVNIAMSPPSSPPARVARRAGVEAILTSRSAAPQTIALGPRQSSTSDTARKVTSSAGPSPSTSLSNPRDFWSGSAHLAPVERPGGATSVAPGGSATGGSSQTVSERRPLALKPRSLSTAEGSSNSSNMSSAGTSSQPHNPYWTRTTSRSAADANANWRGSASAHSQQEKVVAQGPAVSGHPTSATNATSAPSIPAKESLRPTNTRDLSALAKGSAREHPIHSLSSLATPSSGSAVTQAQSIPSPTSGQNGNSFTARKDPSLVGNRSKPMWYYKDPQGSVQGPFSMDQILEWHKAGYYDDELPVSKTRDADFAPLAVAFGLRAAEALGPPGFTATSTAELSAKHVQSGASDGDTSTKYARSTEDLAQEVEAMRLQARNKRGENAGAGVAGAPSASGSSVFDLPNTYNADEIVERGTKHSNLETNVIMAKDMSVERDTDLNVARTVISNLQDITGSEARSDGDRQSILPKPATATTGSPPQKSRLADFMGGDTTRRIDEQFAGSIEDEVPATSSA